MKKLNIIAAAFAAVLAASCVDYSDATGAVSQQIQVSLPASVGAGVNLAGHTITLKSASGASFTAVTDANGVANFSGLTPDVYDVATSWDISAAEYQTLTGLNDAPLGATFTASANSQLVDGSSTIALNTALSIKRDILISKIYAAQSKDNNKKNYQAGQYIELYNQSDNVIDVAGLYIGLVETESKPAYTLDEIKSDLDDSVVLVKQIFRIPTDNPMLVQPGGTVLIANSAIDHSQNSPMEHDLSAADFDVYDNNKKPFQNNPDVPDLPLVWTYLGSISRMNIVNTAQSIIIFRSDDDFSAPKLVYIYGKTKGNQYALVPRSAVIDGVDFLKMDAKSHAGDPAMKRLSADIDAGFTTLSSTSGYTGEVLYRKTTGTAADGHKLLMDTNNSSSDFKTSTTIAPRAYDN